jgi:hypothetical protein
MIQMYPEEFKEAVTNGTGTTRWSDRFQSDLAMTGD